MLLRLVYDIRSVIDKCMITILVVFDFSKEFDLVDHNLLLEKLKHMGSSDEVVSCFPKGHFCPIAFFNFHKSYCLRA